jgi:glyoxylase-like metal-dependent hydrolase (beta-lactamase superfamily II)
MNLREFLPNLWLTELILPEFDVRGAVIVGQDRVLVWDTLSHPRDMAAVSSLAGEKPIMVVYSHADWDHCWGTAGLRADVIIAHDTAAKRFRSGEVADELRTKQATQPGIWDEVRLFPPNVTFNGTLTVDLGGLHVELHPLPGHTEDCLVAFVPEIGVLLAGDTVELPLPVLNKTSPLSLRHWIAQLELWGNDVRVQHMIPSHGAIEAEHQIARTVDYLRGLQTGIAPAVPAEMPPFYTETHSENLKIAGIIK